MYYENSLSTGAHLISPCPHMLRLIFYPPLPSSSPSSSPLCGPLSLSLSSPLSLHHHSLPPSGVTARWLQVAREGGRKGCREGRREGGREGGKGGMEDRMGVGRVCCHLFLRSYHSGPASCSAPRTLKLFVNHFFRIIR